MENQTPEETLQSDLLDHALDGFTNPDEGSPRPEFLKLLNPDSQQNQVEDQDTDPQKPVKQDAEKPTDGKAEPDGMTEKAKSRWGELRQEADRAKELEIELAKVKAENETRFKELETKLPELESKAKDNEELRKKIAIIDFEASEEYDDVINKPFEAIASRAVQIAKRYEIEEKEIFEALEESDPDKREELLESLTAGMGKIATTHLMKMAEDTQDLVAKKELMRKEAIKASAEHKSILAAKKLSDQEKFRKELDENIALAVKGLSTKIPFIAMTKDENEQSYFAELEAKAKNTNFDASSAQSKSAAVTAIHALPRLIAQNTHLQSELADVKKRLSEYQTAKPGGGSTAPSGQAQSQSTGPWIPGQSFFKG